MEKRTFTNILVTLAVLALIPIGLGIYIYLKNQYINWDETYEVESEEPYNNYMVFNLLKSYKTDKEFIFIENLLTEKLVEEEIKDKNPPMSYVFFGGQPNLLNDEVNLLMDFVEKGNTAFFMANHVPDTLFTLLDLGYQGYDYAYDSLISTNFTNSILQNESNFTFNYRIRNKSVGTSWSYFENINRESVKKNARQYKELGFFYKKSNVQQYSNYNSSEDEYTDADSYQENNESILKEKKYTNFIRVKHGKGYFYFHRNPVLFTNYYLIQEDGKKYAERVLSYLPEGDILWDERSHFGKYTKGEYQKRDKSPSPLSYILSQPSLAWGYYTLLVSALLFVIFRGKRMQRIIPILRKEQNTSLEFTKTVGQLYYLQKDHKRLSQLKIRLFFDFIRTKYHMNPQHIDDDFRKKLSERSGISKENIALILSDIQKINGQHEVSEWLLRKIHTQIQEFYTNCK
ncbi:hypothetical protein Fleli_0959 [Bernardetia litoralis DSM 6794]|uniref:DUF4350 domain-containing protein n=1 Tax=Bernardetia litoralis (strain ATCC 23117 / DSM 6794 / NBRC 15988 / NCIMB 1366 / Fx l1 / Sio-4) TaxID=880071 RepID=I4AHH6_BERLS|nr:DUF4350 domain-containing protein [Bernardetia litoralis]AFM03411.1 hypothetical protein Fleli_0959 [Bernardetia litoralis DSM 6794]